jgi:hypothetical protein
MYSRGCQGVSEDGATIRPLLVGHSPDNRIKKPIRTRWHKAHQLVDKPSIGPQEDPWTAALDRFRDVPRGTIRADAGLGLVETNGTSPLFR